MDILNDLDTKWAQEELDKQESELRRILGAMHNVRIKIDFESFKNEGFWTSNPAPKQKAIIKSCIGNLEKVLLTGKQSIAEKLDGVPLLMERFSSLVNEIQLKVVEKTESSTTGIDIDLSDKILTVCHFFFLKISKKLLILSQN